MAGIGYLHMPARVSVSAGHQGRCKEVFRHPPAPRRVSLTWASVMSHQILCNLVKMLVDVQIPAAPPVNLGVICHLSPVVPNDHVFHGVFINPIAIP